MDGEGNFNWRFVFPFAYIPTEKKLVIKEKVHTFLPPPPPTGFSFFPLATNSDCLVLSELGEALRLTYVTKGSLSFISQTNGSTSGVLTSQ